MATIVIYYSYTGNTAKKARELAKQEGAALAEIKDLQRPGALKAYTAGCFAAMRQKSWPILPFSADLTAYDKIILMAPVWAGFPAPAVNSVIERLPAGKTVEIFLVSGSGKSAGKEKVTALAEKRGCTVARCADIK